jgi:hypothetical protein
VDAHLRPSPTSDMKVREAFILAKYRDKAFTEKILDDAIDEGLCVCVREHFSALIVVPGLLELCSPGNEMPSVRDLMHFFVSGAQLDCVDAQKQSLAHLLVQHADSLVSLEFVCRNGAPVDLQDEKGLTALALAERLGNSKAAACLKRHSSALPPSVVVSPVAAGGVSPRAGSSGSHRLAPTMLRMSQVETGSPKEEKRQRTWTSTKPRETIVQARLPLTRQADSMHVSPSTSSPPEPADEKQQPVSLEEFPPFFCSFDQLLEVCVPSAVSSQKASSCSSSFRQSAV